MGLFDRLIERQVLKALSGQRVSDDLIAAILKTVGSGNPVYMPDDVEAYIQDGYLFNPNVYSIVSLIAQKAGTIPWFVYNIKDKKALRLYKAGGPENTVQKALLRHKAIEPLKDHELMSLFERPNPLQGWSEFMEQSVGFKLVTGETFVHAIGPTGGVNAGRVKEMWIYPTQLIDIIYGDRFNPIRGYRYKVDQSIEIPAEEIIHLKYWSPEYLHGAMLHGVSPIRAGRRALSKSNAAYDAGTAAMQNSGMYGFISGRKDSTGFGALTEDQAIALQERMDKYTQAKNRGRVPITSADLQWNQMAMSPVDLALIESEKMDLRTLCNIYHVPSELFNDAANKTYSNTTEASRAIWVNAVIPALTQFRDSFNSYISRTYGNEIYIDFDTSVVPELQDDLAMQVNALQNAWWITPQERRQVMQWDPSPIPEMEMMWIPAGLQPMDGFAEREAARQAEAEAMAAQLNGGSEEDEMEEAEKRLKELGIEDYK